MNVLIFILILYLVIETFSFNYYVNKTINITKILCLMFEKSVPILSDTTEF